MTSDEYTGISEKQWQRFEQGHQIQARTVDNYMRVLFDDSRDPGLRHTEAELREARDRRWGVQNIGQGTEGHANRSQENRSDSGTSRSGSDSVE